MTSKITPYTLPVSGITIMVTPVSISAETMLTRRQYPAPRPPVVTVELMGNRTNERNAADPDYLKAYQLWESELQIEITERVLRRIALTQTLTKEDAAEIEELREALEGLEQLPKNDKILWLFKIAIQSDRDIQAIIKKAAELSDPQEDRIETEKAGF